MFYAITEDREHVVSGLQGILRANAIFHKNSQLPDYTPGNYRYNNRVRITTSLSREKENLNKLRIGASMKSPCRYLSARIRLRHLYNLFKR